MRKSALAICFALVLPIYGQQQSAESASDKKAAKQPAKSNSPTPQTFIYAVNQNGPDKDGNGAEQHPKSYLSRLFSPENLPNIALVVAGIGGIIVAVRTLRVIRRQADLTQATLMLTFPPKLMVRDVILHRENPPFQMPWCIEFTVANIGGSRAHVIESAFDSNVFEDGPPPLLLYTSAGLTPNTWNVTLMPGEDKTFYVNLEDDDLIELFRMYGTRDTSGNVHQRSRFLYFFGRVKYQTDRMTEKQDGFIRSMAVLRHYDLRKGRFVTADDPDYEYGNEE